MSRTYHTTPLQYLVPKNQNIAENIKIVQRKSEPFTFTPLSYDSIKGFLETIDPKFIFGLKEIELKPRFSRRKTLLGMYKGDEKKLNFIV